MVRRFERYGCAAPPPTGAKAAAAAAAAAAAPAVGGFQYPMDDLEHAKHEASRGRAHVVRRPLGGCASAFGVPPAAVADVLQVTDFFRVFGGTALGGVPPFAPADLGAAISMLCATSNHSSANDGGGDAAAPDGAVPSRAAVVSSRRSSIHAYHLKYALRRTPYPTDGVGSSQQRYSFGHSHEGRRGVQTVHFWTLDLKPISQM
jgi:hypothetical protein